MGGLDPRLAAKDGQRRKQASMVDVARLAGVSSQTVSRVSTGFEGVRPATRARVLAAMAELGYRPNAAARALKQGRFRSLGVIVFSLSSTGNSRTVEEIAMHAAQHGHSVTLLPVAARTGRAVRGAFGRLEELAVDGVVVIMEARLLDATTFNPPPGTPVVVVDSAATEEYHVVDTDQVEGAETAVRHLLDLGHETVWHVAGPRESYASRRRAAAWAETLKRSGRPIPALLRGDWSAQSGYLAGLELLEIPQLTAVFVANDQMALGVLRALYERGVRVPEDVSVVGFDDVAEASSYLPPLTTIHQDFAEVGRRCVTNLLAQIRGDLPQPGVDLVSTRLVIRSSTAPPADRRRP